MHAPAKARSDATGMIAQSMPMAAMFMRNKLLSWASLFIAIQSVLNEPANKAETPDEGSQQPPMLRILFAVIAIFTCYIDLVFPNSSPATNSAKLADIASKSASSVISSATGK